MVKALAQDIKDLIRKNPKAIDKLLNTDLKEDSARRIEVPSDENPKDKIVFEQVKPKE